MLLLNNTGRFWN